MLILSRREQELVVLLMPDGRKITFRVVGFQRRHGDATVRLGIDAPADVQIWREGSPSDTAPLPRRPVKQSAIPADNEPQP